jgi:hypothetical protein
MTDKERNDEFKRVKKFRVQVEFTVETFGDEIRLADVVANGLQMFGRPLQELTVEFVKEDK